MGLTHQRLQEQGRTSNTAPPYGKGQDVSQGNRGGTGLISALNNANETIRPQEGIFAGD